MSQALQLKEGDYLGAPVSSRSQWLEGGMMREIDQLKLERLSSGERILDLSMINPDIAPPRYLLDRLLEASVKTNNHRYSVSRGIRKLRQAFSDKYKNKFGVTLDPENEVCVTMGTKDAIVNTLMVCVEPGQVVLMGEPSYPAHVSACQVAEVGMRFFDVSNDTAKMIRDIETHLDEAPVRLILLNFPNNPTGISVSGDFYKELARIVKGRGIILFNDFVYGEMGHHGKGQASLLANACEGLPCIESYSLSKAYGVPGWRVGALCGDSEIVARLARLKSHIDYGVFLPLQIAASAALTTSQDLVTPTTQEYERRARVLCDGLKQMGWGVVAPQAGASVWAKIPENWLIAEGSSSRSMAVTKTLLERENVFVSPGIVYGEKWDSWVRFALVLPSEQLYEVVRKIENCSKA